VDWGVLFAVLAALCTAVATIMQAIGARRVHRYRSLDPRLLLSVMKSGPYVTGLALLALSFVATLVALRSTPLFVVQAIGAASLAVIAGASVVIYRTRLHVIEWGAIGAVMVGVALLLIAQRSGAAVNLPLVGRWALLVAALVLGVGAFIARRFLAGAHWPSLLAGLAFGDAAVASRVVAGVKQSAIMVFAAPVAYSVAVAGLIGALLFTFALQRGSITAVFGMSTVGQTLGPAATGMLLLGDRVHAGMWPVAGVGFALTVGGAVLLGRHAHPDGVRGAAATAGAPAVFGRLGSINFGRLGSALPGSIFGRFEPGARARLGGVLGRSPGNCGPEVAGRAGSPHGPLASLRNSARSSIRSTGEQPVIDPIDAG
jgi:drug/metabolite transporter (DMT)-like permease